MLQLRRSGDVPRLLAALASLYAIALSAAYFLGRTPKFRAESAWFIFGALVLLAAVVQSRLGPAMEAGPAPDRMPPPLLLTVFVAGAFALYWSTLRLGLLSDDFVFASRAIHGDFWSSTSSTFFRPLESLLFAGLSGLFGRSEPVATHVVNLLLHAFNAFLVAALAARWGFERRVGIAAGAIFLCFPASVEAVAWSSGVQDLLLTTTAVGFALAVTSARPVAALVVAPLCLAMTLGTKETAVVAPVLAMLLVAPPISRRIVTAIAGAAIAVGAFALWRLSLVPRQPLPTRYALKQIVSLTFGTLAEPFTRAELGRVPALGIALAVAAAAIGLAMVWRTRTRNDVNGALRAIGWTLVSVAPAYSLFFISNDLQGSRYLYLASCGWSVLVASAFVPRAGHRPAALAPLVAFLGIYAVGAQVHLRDWERAAALRDAVLARATTEVARSTCRPLGFTNLPDSVGGAYVFRNGFVEAMAAAGVAPGSVSVSATTGDCTVSALPAPPAP